MMLDSSNRPGDAPTSLLPAVQAASSEENKENVADGAQKNNEQNLDIENVSHNSHL